MAEFTRIEATSLIVNPYEQHHTNKRPLHSTEFADDFIEAKRPMRVGSRPMHAFSRLNGYECKDMDEDEDEVASGYYPIEDASESSAVEVSKRCCKHIEDYFPCISSSSEDFDRTKTHIYTGGFEDNHITMDSSITCFNCEREMYAGETLHCEFCSKTICTTCDSTCRRCAQAFCRNCTTTLYTQYSSDLVCLDCYRTVHCIN